MFANHRYHGSGGWACRSRIARSNCLGPRGSRTRPKRRRGPSGAARSHWRRWTTQAALTQASTARSRACCSPGLRSTTPGFAEPAATSLPSLPLWRGEARSCRLPVDHRAQAGQENLRPAAAHVTLVLCAALPVAFRARACSWRTSRGNNRSSAVSGVIPIFCSLPTSRVARWSRRRMCARSCADVYRQERGRAGAAWNSRPGRVNPMTLPAQVGHACGRTLVTEPVPAQTWEPCSLGRE